MKRVRFQYDVITVVEFTREDASILIEACARHYDAVVRAQQLFLNALFDIGDEPSVEAKLSYRQIDTLCKAMEGAFACAREREVRDSLIALLRDAGAERARLGPAG